MPTGAELFVEATKRLGIDTIFTLVGDHLNEVLAEAARAGMRIVDLRHESGVTHAADAWARIHRRPALAMVTGGPGHTNALTGVATAHLAGSPLIAVSGGRPRALANRQAFQDIDQVGMAQPVVKWAAEVAEAGRIPSCLARAYDEADSGRKGAVHLTIPVDVFRQSCSAGTLVRCGWPEQKPQAVEGIRFADPFRMALHHKAIDLLREARRPVAIAGSGVWWAGAEDALRRLIEHTSIPLYTMTMARGAVSDEHPLVMGYADPALNRAAAAALREADVVLVAGKRIDYRLAFGGARLFAADARFIQIDIHKPEFGCNRPVDVAIHADAREALETLMEAAGPVPWPERPWLVRVRALRGEWQASLEHSADDRSSPMHPAAFFRELRRALPRDVLYSWDGGDFVHWGRAMIPALHAGGWLRLGPLGTIGSALPNSLALQMAHAGRPVVMVTGDGALGFYLAEMDSLVRHGLPAVIIVGNDAAWGLERELQSVATNATPVACELRASRYDLVMQAFGGGGETIERLDEVRPALERAFGAGAPYCINTRVRGVRSPFTQWQIEGKAAAR
jgi:acetolactate synthase-1/2/3 large subunit